MYLKLLGWWSVIVLITTVNLKDDIFRYAPNLFYFTIVVSLFFYFLRRDGKQTKSSILFLILSFISLLDILCLYSEYDIVVSPDQTFFEFGGTSHRPTINKTSLHIRCFDYNLENGTKTVIFEAGTPFYSTIWGNVLQILNKTSSGDSSNGSNSNGSNDKDSGNPINQIKQYCVYDRFGYGWSDLKYKHHKNKGINGLEAVYDLKEYLHKIDIKDHLILVGWSYGGTLSQLFVSQFPSMVDGVLLVDSMVLDDINDKELISLISQGITSFKVLKFLLPSGITRFLNSKYPLSSGYLSVEDETLKLSNRLKQSTDILFLSYNNIDASKNELSIVLKSISQLGKIIDIQNQQFSNSYFMNNISLVVLTAGNNGTPNWIDIQFQLTHYSTNSIQIVNNSSDHFVPLQAPQSIVNAISLCIVMSNNNINN